MSEYEFEPVPGLPENLPPGEVILWQGTPRWQSLARHAFHAVKIAVYFLILALVVVAWHLQTGKSLLIATGGVIWLAILGSIAVGLLLLLAWAMGRATLFTITSRRVVMRFGVAIELCINLPFAQITSADLKVYKDGTGDIPLTLTGPVRAAYIVLWPYARPWHFSVPQPMLRAVPDAARVAEILADALVTSRAAMPVADATPA
jgi:hypothetical protein